MKHRFKNFFKKHRVASIGLLLIFAQQASILTFQERSERQTWAQHSSTGLYHAAYQSFLYFFYRTGYFPLAPDQGVKLPNTDAAANEFLQSHPKELFMEHKHAIRAGENGKIFLYYPEAWLRLGNTWRATVKTSNIVYFLAALFSLYLAFARIKMSGLGLIICLVVGSYNFQVYETYDHNNVFSWTISTALLALALHLRLLLRPQSISFKRALRTALITGVFLAFVAQIRSEPVAIVGGCLLAYLFSRFPVYKKVLLAAVLMLSLFTGKSLCSSYWTYKTRVTADFLAGIGGTPYRGPNYGSHHLWHPIFAGLADFDKSHDYQDPKLKDPSGWSDFTAYEYAMPFLREIYGNKLEGKSRELHLRADEIDTAKNESPYYTHIQDLPEYTPVIRAKIIADIKADPLWYLEILAKRSWRILTELPPISLSLGFFALNFPATPFVLIFLLSFFVITRKNLRWLLVPLFTLPTIAPAILVYSGRGMAYYAIFQNITAAVVLYWLVAKGIDLSPWKKYSERLKWNTDLA